MPVLESLFNKVAGLGLKVCNFIKKRLQRRFFPANIAKQYYRTPSVAVSEIKLIPTDKKVISFLTKLSK